MPCSSDERYQELLKKYPGLADVEAQLEAGLSSHSGARTTATIDTITYDVPIVIHVVHDYGSENITDNDIYNAVSYWQKVYTKQNADTASVITPFLPYIGNPHIRLHLATIDPNGKPTKGIEHINSYLTAAASDQAKFSDWPRNKYINIWFINNFDAATGNAAAYAYTPGSANSIPFYDGVICMASYINVQKTVPHELGHVLNLKHTWGNTNSPGVACGDDNVDDTPPTKGHNPGCSAAALYDTTCARGYQKTYVSASGIADSVVNYPDTANSQNIMDYTYCELMFSKGQSARMRKALTSAPSSRSSLITAANLAATGALAPMPDLAPVADFVVSRSTMGMAGVTNRGYFLTFNNTASFQFQNASWNDTITDVQWTFSNGATNPTSTGTGLVSNKFSVPGWVSVSLIANSNAGSDTLVNPQTEYVADTTPVGTLSYQQDFTNAASISNWPMFNFYNNQFKWEYFTGAGIGDSSCIRYRSFDNSTRLTGIAIGDHDDFYTPAFNLNGSTGNVYFNFYSAGAYTRYNVSNFDPQEMDSLQIDASINGGTNWTKIAGFNGTNLENNGVLNTEFVPTLPSQWVARTVSVPASKVTANTFFRFRYWPGNMGNNLYIDKFSVSAFPAGVNELINSAAIFSISPNPAINGCSLMFKTGISGKVSYMLKDITGKIVAEGRNDFQPDSIEKIELPRSMTPAAGLYFVTMVIDGMSLTQKMVVF